MRFTIDPWDPAYGVANEADGLDASAARVHVDVEVPGDDWAPRSAPASAAPDRLLFVDGVRRVDARIWIHDGTTNGDGNGDGNGNGNGNGDALPQPGICASFAAGAVICDGTARLGPIVTGRGLFSTRPAEPIPTRAGTYEPRLATSPTVEGLSLSLQERMAEAEITAAEAACAEHDADLVVIDGPLRGRQHLLHAVGYIKTHHVAYLPPAQQAVLASLGPGQRTPLFAIGTGWTRLSWYLRLAAGVDAPWSGVVRCECAIDLPLARAVELADATTAALPRFASEPHKDARAPQNLYPIAGLERELRHRLGDPTLVYRALRTAAGPTL